MSSRRAHRAAIAAASDGSVLINLVEQLPEALQEKLAKLLGQGPLFVGAPLSESDAGRVVLKLDGAAAEATAQLLGGRPKRPRVRARARR